MSVATRRMATQRVGVERHITRDGQGRTVYAADGSIDARVVRDDRVVKRGDGTEVRTQYTIHVDAGQDYLPLHHDRLTVDTLDESRTVVVESRRERKRLNGVIDHVALFCREE